MADLRRTCQIIKNGAGEPLRWSYRGKPHLLLLFSFEGTWSPEFREERLLRDVFAWLKNNITDGAYYSDAINPEYFYFENYDDIMLTYLRFL
jgi:hypothetical protein